MIDFASMVNGPLVKRYVVVRFEDKLYAIEEDKWEPPP